MNDRPSLHLWKPPNIAGVSLFRADHFRQRFARHTHEEYALGTITGGVLGFAYRGASHLAGAGDINVVVPGEVHTGHPALGEDWSYRMFYIQPWVMQDVAGEIGRSSRSPPFFQAGVIADDDLAQAVLSLHHDLDEASIIALEAQSRLIALLATWIRRHAERDRPARQSSRASPDVARVRDFLEACWQRKPQLRQLAELVDLNRYQLLRAFVRQFGLPPHAYLIQRQVREAKQLLERGVSIADAACDSGFADQSHLHRHFKRSWGVTPGQYRDFIQGRRPARH